MHIYTYIYQNIHVYVHVGGSIRERQKGCGTIFRLGFGEIETAYSPYHHFNY